jgi:hypothetical protein
MAKLKLSELTETTATNPGDLLYVVQSNTSKRIKVSNFLADLDNPTLKGNIVIGSTPETITSPGPIGLTTPISYLNIGGVGGVLTIPNGANGQAKILVTIAAAGGQYTLTTNVAGNATVQFNNVGDTATMLYTNSKWFVIGGTANVTY